MSNILPTADSGNSHHHNATISSSLTFTNSKNLDLNHSFVSNKVVGPDRFRFITSYWTTPDTPNGIDVGTSANNTVLASIVSTSKSEIRSRYKRRVFNSCCRITVSRCCKLSWYNCSIKIAYRI